MGGENIREVRILIFAGVYDLREFRIGKFCEYRYYVYTCISMHKHFVKTSNTAQFVASCLGIL